MYLAAADTTIAMVLVQEDNGIEHPIYYLSRNLNYTERKYSYVENLALAAVQAIQRFRHYVLFRKNYHSVRLQPHDLHIVATVARGEIFKMDSNPTRV